MIASFTTRATLAALGLVLAAPAFAQSATSNTTANTVDGAANRAATNLENTGTAIENSISSGAEKLRNAVSSDRNQQQKLEETARGQNAQLLDSVQSVEGAQGKVLFKGKVSELQTDENRFTVSDGSGEIDVQLAKPADVRQGDEVHVLGEVTKHTFGTRVDAEQVVLANPRGSETAQETVIYKMDPQQKQQQEKRKSETK